jgi:hypothetical protein
MKRIIILNSINYPNKMTMNTIECDTFIYEMKDFERDIMMWFEPMTARFLKDKIEEEIVAKPKCFRNAIYKRFLNYKNGKYWWIVDSLTPFDKEQEREELLAIWKMGINHAKGFYLSCYDDKEDKNEDENDERPEILRAIDSWFYEALTEFETKLEKGEINEHQFIIRCNNLKKHKKQVEELLGACVCSAMGRQNKCSIGNPDSPVVDVFRIICLPCGFL